MHLLLIAVNRYAAIAWPIKFRHVNKAENIQMALLVCVWCLPLLVIAPLFVFIFYNPEVGLLTFHFSPQFNLFSFLSIESYC